MSHAVRTRGRWQAEGRPRSALSGAVLKFAALYVLLIEDY